MANLIVIGALPASLPLFRGDLIRAAVAGGHNVVAMAAPADAATLREIEMLGAKFIPFPVQRNGLNPVNDLYTCLSLRYLLKKRKPDVVLAYTIKPVIWAGLALRGSKNVGFYALITGLGFAFQGQSKLRRALTVLASFLYRSSLKNSAGIIFQNPDDQSMFVRQKIADPYRCHIVQGSGVDLQQFPAVPPPSQGVVFLTMARLIAAKGLREFARAAELVKKKYPEAVFKLLGSVDPSPDRVPLEEVTYWQKSGILEYLGSTDDVRAILKECHIYVLASYHEGMPRTVLEAMATGRPILTTDAPGCRETVIQGENGYLVPVGDPKALAERMIWFIENRMEWNRMGRRSRELAEEHFDVHEVTRQLLAIIGIA
jgi:glycosyltransferase involved in cell wall biosynthesis